MATYIDLSLVKQHLNITQDYDDEYLNSLISVVEEYLPIYLECDVKDLCGDDGKFKPAITHAALLLIGNLYAHRESTDLSSLKELPMGFEYLVCLFKDYKNSNL